MQISPEISLDGENYTLEEKVRQPVLSGYQYRPVLVRGRFLVLRCDKPPAILIGFQGTVCLFNTEQLLLNEFLFVND